MSRLSEWAMQPPGLATHIKELMAAIYSPLVSDYFDWLQEAGFRILSFEDLSVEGEVSSVVPYEQLHNYHSATDRRASRLTKYGLAPRGMTVTRNQLGASGQAWYEADRLRPVAPTWQLVADKIGDVDG